MIILKSYVFKILKSVCVTTIDKRYVRSGVFMF